VHLDVSFWPELCVLSPRLEWPELTQKVNTNHPTCVDTVSLLQKALVIYNATLVSATLSIHLKKCTHCPEHMVDWSPH